jgi:hypothetical protein
MLKTFPLVLTFSISPILHADYFTECIKYEAQPEFSRISITNETIRGHRGVDHFKDNSKKYEGKNMFLTRYYQGDSKRIEKVESMDGHEIKSVLTIHPPTGNGFGGANPTNFLQVYFNEKLVLNSPVGYSHRFEITVPKIVIHPQEQMLEVFSNKAKNGVDFGFIEHDDALILEEGKLRSRKRELALPFAVTMTCLKRVSEIRIIDEGIYPTVERQFQKLEKGDKSSFRVAGPFRIFCKDLLDLKFEANGRQVVRIKEEGVDNYRYDFVE